MILNINVYKCIIYIQYYLFNLFKQSHEKIYKPTCGCNLSRLSHTFFEAFVKYPISALKCRPSTSGPLVKASSSIESKSNII